MRDIAIAVVIAGVAIGAGLTFSARYSRYAIAKGEGEAVLIVDGLTGSVTRCLPDTYSPGRLCRTLGEVE